MDSLIPSFAFRSLGVFFIVGKDREKSINASLANIKEIEGNFSYNPSRNPTIQNELGDSLEIDD